MARRKKRKREPGFTPSEQQRLEVEVGSAFGIPQEQLCRAIINPRTRKPIDGKTLRKKFAPEIANGIARWKMRIAGWLAADAAKGDRAVRIFLGKVVLGLRETSRHEHTGKDGGPIQTYDLSKLTDEQLANLEKIVSAATVSGADPGGEGQKGG